jgi:hypothetical protein
VHFTTTATKTLTKEQSYFPRPARRVREREAHTMKSSNVCLFFQLLFLLPRFNNAQLTTTPSSAAATLLAGKVAATFADQSTVVPRPKYPTSTITNTVFGIIEDVVNDEDDDDNADDAVDEFVGADEPPTFNNDPGYPIFSEEDDFGKYIWASSKLRLKVIKF